MHQSKMSKWDVNAKRLLITLWMCIWFVAHCWLFLRNALNLWKTYEHLSKIHSNSIEALSRFCRSASEVLLQFSRSSIAELTKCAPKSIGSVDSRNSSAIRFGFYRNSLEIQMICGMNFFLHSRGFLGYIRRTSEMASHTSEFFNRSYLPMPHGDWIMREFQ